MTIEQSPVTILGDLIEQLESKIDQYEISTSEALARAYAAGADQELEACCEWMDNHLFSSPSTPLRAARRPKPPSLKAQALAALAAADGADHPVVATVLTADQHAIICRALEALPE